MTPLLRVRPSRHERSSLVSLFHWYTCDLRNKAGLWNLVSYESIVREISTYPKREADRKRNLFVLLSGNLSRRETRTANFWLQTFAGWDWTQNLSALCLIYYPVQDQMNNLRFRVIPKNQRAPLLLDAIQIDEHRPEHFLPRLAFSEPRHYRRSRVMIAHEYLRKKRKSSHFVVFFW